MTTQRVNKTHHQKTHFFETKTNILTLNSEFISVVLNIQNKPYYFLLDTGASISVIQYNYAKQLCIPICFERTPIKGVGGTIDAIGYITLPLQINNECFIHKFIVFNNLPIKTHGILGNDFLAKYDCTINYALNKMTMFSNYKIEIPLLKNDSNAFYHLPARTESTHFIESNETEDSIILSMEITNGIFLASTIVTPYKGKIPIHILNTTEDDYILPCHNIKPTLHSLNQYEICTYEDNSVNATRVKEMFKLLKLEHLNQEEKCTIENICAKYSDIFYLPGDKLTITNVYKQNISLKDNTTPVYIKPYRLPNSQKTEIKNQINKMLAEGIIEPSNSDWSSPVLLVPKKSENNEKKWRLVIDYRKLNNVIQDDKYPLPNISEIIDSLAGSIYFTHLDLNSGYYQIELEPECRKYTAFDSGQYQMTRMPMGLKTSPSAFSRMMHIAMSGLSYEKCLIYLDDLIVFGKNLLDHNKNLIKIFQRLREKNLKLNPNKCNFLRKEILYLGHIVSADGILPDSAKIDVLVNYPKPCNVDEVKRFVAFVNYYRKFIPNFAEKAYPLNYLCRKNITFSWDKNCDQAFELLKQCLTTYPILQYPDFSNDNTFIIQTDASNVALGAILSNKNGKPVAYASRNLNKAEQRYPVIEKELLAIVWATKHFRPYIYGQKFIIRTDHKPLVYLFGMKDPSSRLMKFRLLLEEYDFTVEYVKGSDNAAADALSRISLTSNELKELGNDNILVMTRAQRKNLSKETNENEHVSRHEESDLPYVSEHINKPKESVELKFIKNDELLKLKAKNKLNEKGILIYDSKNKNILIKLDSRSQLTPSEFARDLNNFCEPIGINEIYFVKNKNNEIFVDKLAREINKNKNWSGPKLCIIKDKQRISDKDNQRVILNDFHLLPTSGHAGINRMYNTIKRYYFWPGLRNDIINYVKKCCKCQKQKHSIYTKEPMCITSTAGSAFEKIFMDIVGPLPKDDYNYSYILSLQCELTKYVEVYPLKTKGSVELARSFVNNFILRYGIPKQIGTDRGTEFLSNIFQEVCTLLNIKQLNSTAYHHQSIGALENSHKHLGAFLRIQTDNRAENWSDWLQFWSFSYNTMVHTETQYTPYELVFGKKCILPTNLKNIEIDPVYNYESYPKELKFRLQTAQKDAFQHLIESKNKRKLLYDEKINPITYKTGDLILVKNESGNKLDNIYEGPYTVIEDISPNVKINKNDKIDVIHKNRTKLFIRE